MPSGSVELSSCLVPSSRPPSHAHPHMPTLTPTLTYPPSHAHPHTHTLTHTPSQVLPPVGSGSKGAVHSAADSTRRVSWATAGGAGAYVAVFTKTCYRRPIPVACRCRRDLNWSIRCSMVSASVVCLVVITVTVYSSCDSPT